MNQWLITIHLIVFLISATNTLPAAAQSINSLPKQATILVTMTAKGNGLSSDKMNNLPLQRVGNGTMSWLFWDLYNITLYSETGSYQTNAYPQALSIQYLKDIDKNDLVTATKDQWQHLNINWQEQWLKQIDQLWPPIKQNDRLTLIISENGYSHFYYNKNRLGQIEDIEFSKAFIAIWLSPNTSEPKLRKKLLNRP